MTGLPESARSASGVPEPEDLVRSALRELLRGGSWEALAREIAWRAVHAGGANYATIEWLTPLVEQRLAERIAGLEYQVDMASVRARQQWLRRRPGDRERADNAAAAEGYNEATRKLHTFYQHEVEWAAAVISDRLEHGRRRERHSPLQVRRRRSRVDEDPHALSQRLPFPPRRHAA
jgi:hypothetical protein